ARPDCRHVAAPGSTPGSDRADRDPARGDGHRVCRRRAGGHRRLAGLTCCAGPGAADHGGRAAGAARPPRRDPGGLTMTETTTAPASPPAALPTTDVCVMCGEEQAERRGLCPLCRAEVELIYAPTLRARIVAL